MKVFVIVLAIVVIALISFNVFAQESETDSNPDYLRVHITANSNSNKDSRLKYEIKDAVVDYLTPYLASADDKDEAYKILKKHLDKIQEICNSICKNNNLTYTCTVNLVASEFPARTYGELTLESGVYDSLDIKIGNAKGDNWWCVVFPPLCFVPDSDDKEITYKSLFAQLIGKLFG